MFEYFLLKPFGEGENSLNSIKLQRDEEIIVGRNRETFQSHHENILYISRRHVKFLWCGKNEVFVTALTATESLVSVNDVILKSNDEPKAAKEGDNICLMHKLKCFNFKIVGIEPLKGAIEGVDSSVSKATEDEKNESKVDSTCVKNSGEDLVSRTECPICLLPLAFAHSIHPCGHHFCYTCLLDWSSGNTTCPSCQATIIGMNPSHMLNDIVEGVLSKSEDTSVLKDWQDRVAEGIELKKNNDNKIESAPHKAPTPNNNNIMTMLSGSRKRQISALSDTTELNTNKKASSVRNSSSAIIDLTAQGSSSFETPRSDPVPQHCIAFHIQPEYKSVDSAKCGFVFKQVLDTFDSNANGLSNACWNPHRRCKHCRHLITLNSLVVSSVGAPCFQKLFHVQCLSSYNRGLQFLGQSAMDRAITFEKIVNADFLDSADITQLRYNTIM